jgi:hypothetical protein
MIYIHKNFVGGNISVIDRTDTDVFLENELRDSDGDWFYWAFCVENARGKELTFHMQKNRLGYWGPAVSHDLKEWHWLGERNGNSFPYRFAENEDKVYFAHHLLYPMGRFSNLAKRHGTEIKELCVTKKGRSVPCLEFGEGANTVILTARHHACESTGSYVLEGVLEEILCHPIPNTRVFCVPFVDLDGVLDGDQGKNRIPHDHNRDYIEDPIYPEVAAIKRYAEGYGCHFAFDFHSPWHKGGENNNVFIVRNRTDRLTEYDRFGAILEKECNPKSMAYSRENDCQPCTGWNQPSSNFSYVMHCRQECRLAFSLESAYFGCEENKVSSERLIELGKAFGRALHQYIEEDL